MHSGTQESGENNQRNCISVLQLPYRCLGPKLLQSVFFFSFDCVSVVEENLVTVPDVVNKIIPCAARREVRQEALMNVPTGVTLVASVWFFMT